MSDTAQSGFDRRKFLKGAAAGGAALSVGAVAGTWLRTGDEAGNAAAPNTATMSSAAAAASVPMAAYVRDPASGEVVIMAGTQEVVVRDQVLASRLLAAASGIA